jgi:hypothetical protein
MGYMGGYTSEGACCGDGMSMAPATMAPMTTIPMQSAPATGSVQPMPMGE